MKMENDIVAAQDGVIASVNVSNGESVETGQLLVSMN
jgi:biotin carboxyl carrier protein